MAPRLTLRLLRRILYLLLPSRRYLTSGKSFKAHCAAQKRIGKSDFALAAETIKYSTVLDKIFSRIRVSAESLDVGRGLLKVMCYEVLFGKLPSTPTHTPLTPHSHPTHTPLTPHSHPTHPPLTPHSPPLLPH